MQLFAASDAWNLRSTFGLSATALMAVFLPLFFVFVRYPSSVDSRWGSAAVALLLLQLHHSLAHGRVCEGVFAVPVEPVRFDHHVW